LYKRNNVGFLSFELPAYKISIVPGQTPNVLGEEWIWCEVDTSEAGFYISNGSIWIASAQRYLKNFSYNKAIFYKHRIW